jgi:LmbE family N-acetylglucosaminyl deacetylase
MLTLDLPARATDVLSILCVGAHCDDIEIGCGGTLLELTARHRARITWLILSSDAERAGEAKRSAAMFLGGAAETRLVIKNYRDGFLPYLGAQVKDEFEALKVQVRPDLIFTHYRHDLHQDHRLISELTWNTFRDHLILEYEVPKYDGDLGHPNAFSLLSANTCQRKVAALLESYPSQAAKKWFSADLFMALLRLRGLESNSPSGLAEAFHCRKLGFLWDRP